MRKAEGRAGGSRFSRRPAFTSCDHFLWQFMHRPDPLTDRPSTVVIGPVLFTHSMFVVFFRLCGSWQLVQPTVLRPSAS